jgi:5-oxoprolinase (ATP-hydrolysing) subunit A
MKPTTIAIDLNSDLGEGFGIWRMGADVELLDAASSANIACGFHAGDASIMRHVCEMAVQRGVSIGAHVAYQDLVGFGRRRMEVDPQTLANDVIYQIGALDAFARLAGDRVRYVKPHGALYNTVVTDAEQARAVVAAVRSYDPNLAILGLPGSRLLQLAGDAGLRTVAEAFVDRAYESDGTLTPRGRPGAVSQDASSVVARAVRLAFDHEVETIDGGILSLHAESLCIHGDTPNAAELARRVRFTLEEAGCAIVPFARATAVPVA